MCRHHPPCPAADASDREAAQPVSRDDVTGWSLLCNGVVLFQDGGELLPGGRDRRTPPRGPDAASGRGMSGKRQYRQDGLRVPFIAPWSLETVNPAPIVRRRGYGGEGIGYEDEHSDADRRNDVLWIRVPVARGVGRALLAGVHALRQRQAMTHMLCQVCGESTLDRPDERHLFLMRGEQSIAEGEKTASPPLHESCAAEAARDCPHLRDRVAALVELPLPWGVAGIVYDPTTLSPVRTSDDPSGLTFVAYDDPLIRWALATREVFALHGCTTVRLPDLAAQTAH